MGHRLREVSKLARVWIWAATISVALGACLSDSPEAKGPGAVSESPTATATVTVQKVKIFLIALSDNGRSGKAIGCGDSVVAVEREITPTQAVLRAALDELLAIKSQRVGDYGLYNALYQSDLRVDSLSISNGVATVRLSGVTMLGGVCDIPRFQAQIEETALQFPTVREVSVFINGVPMREALSLR